MTVSTTSMASIPPFMEPMAAAVLAALTILLFTCVLM